MSIFTRLFQRQINKQVQKALRDAPQVNELYKQLNYQTYGVYNQLGNEDDPIDYGFNINTTVWAIVNRISRSAAKVPLVVQEKTSEGWEDIEHDLLETLHFPNELQAKTEFLQEMYAFKLVTGNSYVYSPVMSERDIPRYFYNAPAHKIEIVASGNYMMPIKGYELDDNYKSIALEPFKVMHMKNLNLDYDQGQEFYGRSALQVALEVLKKDAARETRQKNNYENSGAYGFMYRDGDVRMTPEQQMIANRAIQNDLKANSGSIALLQEKMNYVNLGMSPADLEIIEDAKWSIKDLCNVYNVPSVLFGDSDNSKYNNVKEAKKDLYLNAVLPEVESFCDEFNRQWMHLYGENLRLNYDKSGIEELQNDKKELVEWASKSPITVNEFRDLLGKEPLEGEEGNIIVMPAGNVPLEQVAAMNILRALEEPS